MSGPFDYPCFDFTLRSDIRLPELAGTRPPRAGDAIVAIRRAGFPDTVASAGAAVAGVQVEGDRVILTVPHVARFQIRGGIEICVDPAPGASAAMVRLFLLGSALGILSLQRGLFLLHANAVVIDGRAFAFAGPSGAGKSTLAGHFQRAGHAVLCDDVCGIRFDAAGVPIVWPGLPRLKLWRDAAEALGHDPDAYDRVAEGYEKVQIPYRQADVTGPVPLAALYILDRATPDAAVEITRLTGVAAMAATMENSYRAEYHRPLGLSAAHFGHCSALLAHIGVYRAPRRWGFDVFAEEVARIERHAAGLAHNERERS